MKNILLKKGFSLAEVLIATIVMSMIMGSVLAFVQYAGSIWQKGNEKISSDNYSRMAFELIKQDLLQASSVSIPSANNSSQRLVYKYNSKKYKIEVDKDTLIRTSNTGAKISATGNENTMRLARNVKFFGVKRISKHTFEISLQINTPEYENDDGELASDTISSESMVLIAPGIN